MASLVVMIGTLGGAIGTAISGAINTNTFREELVKALGDNSTPELIDALFNSMTSTLILAWGTVERTAVKKGEHTSNDSQNLIEENGMLDGKIDLMHRAATADGHPSVPDVNKETKEVK
ncbi:hypothetical protein BKA61DRAFT_733257 [Leptodontidium sp. MPI-SDFR-AT-0119]|nr:hypothetical protein BKA61DRAFT_733257 [Leptodontidium sp. MPI-SDFR-AT-0119]